MISVFEMSIIMIRRPNPMFINYIVIGHVRPSVAAARIPLYLAINRLPMCVDGNMLFRVPNLTLRSHLIKQINRTACIANPSFMF